MTSTHLRRSSALPGTEQPALAGLADQRTALWPHYDNSTAMYAFLSRVNAIRRSYGLGPGGSDMMTEAMVVGDPSQHSLLFVRRMHPVDWCSDRIQNERVAWGRHAAGCWSGSAT